MYIVEPYRAASIHHNTTAKVAIFVSKQQSDYSSLHRSWQVMTLRKVTWWYLLSMGRFTFVNAISDVCVTFPFAFLATPPQTDTAIIPINMAATLKPCLRLTTTWELQLNSTEKMTFWEIMQEPSILLVCVFGSGDWLSGMGWQMDISTAGSQCQYPQTSPASDAHWQYHTEKHKILCQLKQSFVLPSFQSIEFS